ncbi:hypothetical protein CR513_60247, partial [Mucuna pruriens]
MDIRPAYSCLLGKPWIHAIGAVPSSLYQKVIFIADQQLISVIGEKELMINTPLLAKYVEGDKEELETSFQTLEIVGTTSAEVEEGGSKLSKAAIMAAKVLISNGFHHGKGLGKDLDGIVEPVALQENPIMFRLGYTEDAKERRPRRKMPGMAGIRPDLYRYFISWGIITLDQTAMIEDQLLELKEWVIPTSQELDNWTTEALPKLVSQKM